MKLFCDIDMNSSKTKVLLIEKNVLTFNECMKIDFTE